MNTEKQASELWCPMVRHEGDSGGTFNRGIAEGNETNRSGANDKLHICNCIASRCAMWRWANLAEQPGVFPCADREAMVEPARPKYLPESWKFVPYDGEEAFWVESEEDQLARRTGYCGLSGKPMGVV